MKTTIAIPLLLVALNVKAAGNEEGALKEFLANRPPIKKIVFLKTDYTNGVASNSYLYEGGWNKEDFYLKRFVLKPTSVVSPSSSVANFQSFWGNGKEGKKYWQMTGSNDLVLAELQPQSSSESNPIVAHVLNSKLNLDQALNLEIQLLKTSTLKWNGDTFIGEYENGIARLEKVTYKHKNGPEKTIDHPQIYGQAIRENGQIRGAKITNYSPEFPVSYFLNFQYDSSNPLPHNLPNSILAERIVDKSHKKESIGSTEILSIEFSDTNSPVLAYSTANYVESASSYNLVFSNNQYYTFSSNGTLKLLDIANTPPPSSNKIKQTKFIIITFMALAIAGLLSILHFGIKSQERKDTKQ